MRRSLLLTTVAAIGLGSLAFFAPPLSATASPGVSARAFREVTIPAGTALRIRLEQAVGSDVSRIEQPVRAELTRALVVNGETVVPAGSSVYGVVTEATRSGRVKGRARLGMRFHTLASPWSDARYAIRTTSWVRQAPGTKRKDAAKIVIPAAGGGIIGGLVGGKKGAAIGAATGGGAGTAVVMATRGPEVRLGRGSVVLVRLARPVTLEVRR